MVLDATVSQFDDDANTLVDTLFGGSARASGTTTATGAVVNATFTCINNGSSTLHLVSSVDRPTQFTTTLGGGGVVIGTLLSDAQINCSNVLPPTPTPSPAPTSTPTPAPQVCTFAQWDRPGLFLRIREFSGGQVVWGWFDDSVASKATHIAENNWGGIRELPGGRVLVVGRAVDTQGRSVRVIGSGMCPSGPGRFMAFRLSPMLSIITLVDKG
jgi:hypothetical protein